MPPRTLDQLAAEAAVQVTDLPPMRRAEAIAEALRTLRPNADPDAIREAAAAAAGYTGPPAPAGARARRPAGRRSAPKARPARRPRARPARAVRQVAGTSFGRVFRAGLYLTGLYWLLRTAGAVEAVTAGARSGLTWLFDPSLTLAPKAAELPATDA